MAKGTIGFAEEGGKEGDDLPKDKVKAEEERGDDDGDEGTNSSEANNLVFEAREQEGETGAELLL